MLDAVTEGLMGNKLDAMKRQSRLLDMVSCKKKNGGNSFDADTRVLMANGRSKAISAVRLNERVLATDPATGVTTARAVTARHINQDTALTDVRVRDRRGRVATIDTTDGHPFWNATDGRWTEADELEPGDQLRTPKGEAATVVDATSFTGDQPMFNLTVDGPHTYYVLAGRAPVLVHNFDCGKVLDTLEGNTPEVAKHNDLVQRRWQHTFDEKAAQWFGYASNADIPKERLPLLREQWKELVRYVGRSNHSGPWTVGAQKTRTSFHMAKKNGRWFVVQFYAEGPMKGYLATAFVPNDYQLSQMKKLAGIE